MQLTIDSEFKSVIPAQTAEECAALEASLLAEGCRDALVVWQGKNILIDGHHRYDICTRHNIPFKTVGREFASREDVIIWMVDNQLARRNLTDAARIRLAHTYKKMVAAQAEARMKAGVKADDPVANLPQGTAGKTREKLAEKAGISARKYDQGETVIEDAPQATQELWDSGEISTYRAYELTKVLENLPPDDREPMAAYAGDNLEKAQIFIRLYKSAGSPQTNGTYYEILRTGGFAYGDEMDKRCDVKTATVEQIRKALDSIESYHRAEGVKNKPHVAHNSGENEWYTPPEYIEAARRVLGDIDLDPASSELANQTVQAKWFYSLEDSGLEHDWRGTVWMNPPYAGDLIKQFTSKFAAHVKAGDITAGIVLVNNATETQWFYELANCARAVVFPKGRIRYISPDGKDNSPLQGQAILYFGTTPQIFLSEFEAFGWGATMS